MLWVDRLKETQMDKTSTNHLQGNINTNENLDICEIS